LLRDKNYENWPVFYGVINEIEVALFLSHGVYCVVQCDVTCGDGGTRRRIVYCQLPSGDVLPDSSCLGSAPPRSQHCHLEPCPPQTTLPPTTTILPSTTTATTTTAASTLLTPTPTLSAHWKKSRWSSVSVHFCFVVV